MKLGRLMGFLVIAMFLVPLAKADGPVSMVFVGVNGANNGQYYVSPYYGTMNGQQVVLFCDDIKNEVTFGETWSANVTNLGTAVSTNNFSQTRYGGVSTSAIYTNNTLAYYNNPAMAYEEAAYLVTQFASHPNDLVNLQYALWDIMNPGNPAYMNSDVQNWLTMAGTDYNQINPYNFEIVTNTGTLALTGQVQEFIVQTPEPGTLVLLVCGALLLSMCFYNRRQLIA